MQDARFEMTNDLLGALFASEDGLTDFCQWLETDKNTTVKQKKTILEQLKELIQKAVERLKEYFNKEKFTDTQKAVSEMELKQAQQLRQQCLDILDHAISNLENGVEISNGNKYSFDNFDKIKKFDVENIKAKGNKVIDNEKDLLQCVENSLNNRQLKENYYLGNIKQGVKERITNDLNLDIFKKGDYSFSLSSDDIRHIYEHFGSSNDIVNAIYRLYDVVNNYDTVSIDDEQRKRFKKNVLVFNKSYSDYDFRSVEIASKKNRTFDLVSFFVTKNNKKRNNGYGPANTENNGELASRTATASNNSIYKKSKNVKKYSLDVDSEGNKLSEQQQEYFKNSKVRDENGNLQVVYHGTTNEFTVFDRQFGNSEGDWGKGFYFTTEYDDVEQNYANKEGPDLKIKIERYAERLEMEDEYADLDYDERLEIAKQKYITLEPNIIEAYLNITNPVNVGSNETYFDYEESYDEEYDEYSEPEGLLVDFVEALNSNLDKFEYWGDIDFWSALGDDVYNGGMNISDIVENLNNNLLDEIIDDEGNIAIKELIRMSLEDMGFDGIIDTTVSDKFSAMNGLYDTTTHYIVFNSNQAKNTDNQTPTSNEDIRYSIDIDEFDAEDYTYPRLAKKEYNRLRREALAFNADKVNKIITQNLDNGYKYVYYFDDEYNLTVLGKYKSINIHERYNEDDGTRNRIAKHTKISGGNRKYGGNGVFSTEKSKATRSNAKFSGTDLQQKRSSDRRGNAQNGNHDNLSEEKRYSIDIDEYDTRSLIKQNKQLQKSVEYYKMMLGYNSGHKVNRNKIRSYAVELKKQWNTALSTDDIADSLTEIFDFISSGNATWDSIESMGNALGKEIVYNIKQEIDPDNKAVLDDLNRYIISISNYQRDEIKYYYGGVGALTKKCESCIILFGR